MKKIILYIAASLDGYIARTDGSLDWLDNLDNPDKSDYGYGEFIESVDTIIMGRKTYEVVSGFDIPWPYTNKKTYVVSRSKDLRIDSPDTHLLPAISQEAINALRKESDKNIWLVGGGHLVSSFVNLHAIDEIILSLVPVVLGEGIPLFPDKSIEVHFALNDHQVFSNGLVQLHYVLQQD